MRIYVDFDGTITQRDTIVYLTERWGAGPRYRQDILQAIEDGSISVFEAIRSELATVRLPWEEAAQDLLENVRIDPEFEGFVEWCRSEKLFVAVVSSGVQRVVSLYVKRFDLPIFAHPVEMKPTGWVYRRDEAMDKVTILKAEKGNETVVYVGDGTSDVAVIPHVDLLFAKSYLARYCRRHSIPFLEYQGFGEVLSQLEPILREEEAGKPPRGSRDSGVGQR